MKLAFIGAELDAADCHVVSVAACVTLEMLHRIRPGRYSMVIRSLASEVGCGVSLVCHGPEARPGGTSKVKGLLCGSFPAIAAAPRPSADG